MKSVQALAFLCCATYAFGASLTFKEQPSFHLLDFLSSNVSYPKTNDKLLDNGGISFDTISPSDFSVGSPHNSFAIGHVIAEVARNVVDLVSKMEISEQSLKSLIQLAIPLISIYIGPYAQVILPMLSGVATVLIKSLAH